MAAEAYPQQTRSSAPLAAFFLVLSFLISLAFLAHRNIYDDEIASTSLLLTPTARIIQTMNHTDVHPPGMYVLAHWGYAIVPSARWVTIFPLLCLYGGLTVFVLAVAPLFRSPAARVCFLLLATLHPQLLMWGNSIRWYPWWAGLALLTLVVALNPRNRAAPLMSKSRALATGVLIGCLFYLNYITLIFTVALAAGLFVRYSRRAWKPLLLTALTAIVLIAPQLKAFLTVHLAGSGGQRSSPLLSIARLLQSLFSSEAFLPWHPVAVMAALLMMGLSAIGALQGARYLRSKPWVRWSRDDAALASVVVVALLFLALVAVTGLGGKPRNGLALVPMLAPCLALVVGGLRSRTMQILIIAVLAIWSGWGELHLLRRSGLTKASMINRPDEVLHYIEDSRANACSVVVTYDPTLSFYLVESRLPRQLVLTLSQNNLYRNAAPFSPEACPAMKLYIVQSYLGGLGGYETILTEELRTASRFLSSPAQIGHLSYDPDARFKRRLTFIGDSAALPDFRYIVGSGTMSPTDLPALENALPYLVVADGHTVPRQQ